VTDLWTEAARDLTDERLTAAHTAARVSTVDIWSTVLAPALSQFDFENRLALVGPKLDEVVSGLVNDDPSLFLQVRTALNDSLFEDFTKTFDQRMAAIQARNDLRAFLRHGSYTWEKATAGDIKPGDVWRFPEEGQGTSPFQADNASWDNAFGDNPVGRGAGQVSPETVNGKPCVRIDSKDGNTNLGVYEVDLPVEIARTASQHTAGSKSARDLAVGDKISQGTVSKVDTTTTPGVVYVYVNGKTDPPADVTYNHGDPVTVSDTTASRKTADGDASITRTRVSIPTQLKEKGHTVDATTGADGRLVYKIDGEEMDLKAAADKYLGGWDNAFGKSGAVTAGQPSTKCPQCQADIDPTIYDDGTTQRMIASCKQCGWRGSKTKPSQKTAANAPDGEYEKVNAFVSQGWDGLYGSRYEKDNEDGTRLWKSTLHSPDGPVVWTLVNADGSMVDMTARGATFKVAADTQWRVIQRGTFVVTGPPYADQAAAEAAAAAFNQQYGTDEYLATEMGVTASKRHVASTRYDIAKSVVDGGIYDEGGKTKKLEGAILDGMTAGAIVAVYEALSPEMQAKFDSIPLDKLIDFCWKKVTIGVKLAAVGDTSTCTFPGCGVPVTAISNTEWVDEKNNKADTGSAAGSHEHAGDDVEWVEGYYGIKVPVRFPAQKSPGYYSSKKTASTSTCQLCGEAITQEGDLWVTTRSGDEGGSYDWCEENNGGPHMPTDRTSSKTATTGDKAVCANCDEPIESIGIVGEDSSLGMTPGEHWVHISTDPRAPIGSAQCTGDHWGEIATPKPGSFQFASGAPDAFGSQPTASWMRGFEAGKLAAKAGLRSLASYKGGDTEEAEGFRLGVQAYHHKGEFRGFPKKATITPNVAWVHYLATRKTAAPTDGQTSYCRICGVEMEGQDYAWYALSASSPKRDVGKHEHLPARNADWPGEYNVQGELVPGQPGGGGGQYDAPAGTIYDGAAKPIFIGMKRRTALTIGEMEGRSYEATCPNPACEYQGTAFVHDDLSSGNEQDDDVAECPECDTPLVWDNRTASRTAAYYAQVDGEDVDGPFDTAGEAITVARDYAKTTDRKPESAGTRKESKLAKQQCVYAGDESKGSCSDDIIEVHSGRPEPTYICGKHEQQWGIPQSTGARKIAYGVACPVCAYYGMIYCRETVGTCDRCGQMADVDMDYSETGDRENPNQTLCLDCLSLPDVHFDAAHKPDVMAEYEAFAASRKASRKIADGPMPVGSVRVYLNPAGKGTSKDNRIDVTQVWGPTYAETIYQGYDAAAAQVTVDLALTKARSTQEGKDAAQYGSVTASRRMASDFGVVPNWMKNKGVPITNSRSSWSLNPESESWIGNFTDEALAEAAAYWESEEGQGLQEYLPGGAAAYANSALDMIRAEQARRGTTARRMQAAEMDRDQSRKTPETDGWYITYPGTSVDSSGQTVPTGSGQVGQQGGFVGPYSSREKAEEFRGLVSRTSPTGTPGEIVQVTNGRMASKTASYPEGRSTYRPGMGRMGEPSPQSNPNQFSSEDILAEIKYLIALNARDGSNVLRTMAYTKLMKVLSDRGYTGEAKTASEGEPERKDCPNCGSGQMYATSGYCPQCGETTKKTAGDLAIGGGDDWVQLETFEADHAAVGPSVGNSSTCRVCGKGIVLDQEPGGHFKDQMEPGAWVHVRAKTTGSRRPFGERVAYEMSSSTSGDYWGIVSGGDYGDGFNWSVHEELAPEVEYAVGHANTEEEAKAAVRAALAEFGLPGDPDQPTSRGSHTVSGSKTATQGEENLTPAERALFEYLRDETGNGLWFGSVNSQNLRSVAEQEITNLRQFNIGRSFDLSRTRSSGDAAMADAYEKGIAERAAQMAEIERLLGALDTTASKSVAVLDTWPSAPSVDFGEVYGDPATPSYWTQEGDFVWMFRKGQKVRFYNQDGQQVGPDMANVAPAVAYANEQGWDSGMFSNIFGDGMVTGNLRVKANPFTDQNPFGQANPMAGGGRGESPAPQPGAPGTDRPPKPASPDGAQPEDPPTGNQAKDRAVAKLRASILATNPGLTPTAAEEFARSTVDRFPSMVKGQGHKEGSAQ
jgi:hypothetical protein